MSYVWPSVLLRQQRNLITVTRSSYREPLLGLFSRLTSRHSQRSTRSLHCDNGTRSTRAFRSQDATLTSRRALICSRTLAIRSRQLWEPCLQKTSYSTVTSAPKKASHIDGVDSQGEEECLSWRDYDPAGGMPIPGGDRSAEEVQAAFGDTAVDAETGNYILNVMYWRRLSGALIDSGLDFPLESGVTRQQAAKGLEYIRSLSPEFDEQAAGEVWVQEESLRLEEQIQERAMRLGIYKREEGYEQPEPESEEQQGTEYGRERSGESQLVRIRKANEAAWEQEQAEAALAEEKAEQAILRAQRGPLELAGGVQPDTQLATIDVTGISISSPRNNASLQPHVQRDWVKYYEERAQLFKSSTIPQLSLTRRLGPSLLVLCTVLLLADFLASNYTLPPESARLWPDVSPAVASLTGLSSALVFFFLASRLPPLWRTYSKHFTVVPAYPHALGIVGAIFRNDRPGHLLFNLASLWIFGLMLHDDIGRGAYMAVFLSAGAAGGYASLCYNVLRKNWATYIYGASGAILGTVGAACVLRPNGTLKIYGQEIPIAAWVFAALYVGREAFAILRPKRLDIDHVGHLGGLLSGMAMAAWWKFNRGREVGKVQEYALNTKLSRG